MGSGNITSTIRGDLEIAIVSDWQTLLKLGVYQPSAMDGSVQPSP